MMTMFPYLIAFATLVIVASVRRIPEGQAFTVHRFGRYQRTLPEGLHWTLPIIERIAHRVALAGHCLQMRPQGPSATDNRIQVFGKIYFQLVDPQRANANADHLDDVVLEHSLLAIKSLPQHSAIDQDFNRAVKLATNKSIQALGIIVTRCELSAQIEPAVAA